MKNLNLQSLIFLSLLFFFSCANSQSAKKEKQENRPDLYDCEGCEAIFEAPKNLTWDVQISKPNEVGEALMISGKIYQTDGKTPAPNVILYVYHTNSKGIYDNKGIERGWGKRHGNLRAWIKTNEKGEYRFKTIKPASYPKGRNPAHIHAIVREPNRQPYWIDEYLFEGDPYISQEEIEKAKKNPRGGLGIIKLAKNKEGIWIGKRDIILEN